MMKRQIIPTLLGIVAAGVVTQPATALTLTLVQSGESSDPAPIGFTQDLKIFESEWRAGASDEVGDYEAAIGPNGANYPLAGTFQIDWGNAQEVVWDIDYTSFNGVSELTITPTGGTPQSVIYDSPLSGLWKKFALFANVKPHGLVAEGTSIEIAITDINGCALGGCDLSSTPTSATYSTNLSEAKYFSTDDPITSMKGKVIISWTSLDPQPSSGGARSAVAVKLKAFDPPTIDPAETIPEPGTLLSLLTVGGLGLLSGLKSKKESF